MEEPLDPHWRKSSYSANGGADCIEVRDLDAGVLLVRDTKDRDGRTLGFSADAWNAFVASLR
jgi:hypothetical protein